ncbi:MULTISPECIES: glutamate 5-kinase [unclassified Roseitalea]|uniref:glutamate 5-kinase n=1 Tax=unclassified Roseitalea TaxID=2639107 RepID=UPI00273DB795|nr:MULTISPECIES: glutamate 5-kinase [unclassified Roseitalea]
MRTALAGYRRIAVKIGSALLVDPTHGLRAQWLDSLADDIAELKGQGHDVLVVSSGAIALGRTVLSMPAGPLRLEESQAAAAAGQIALAHAWKAALARHAITTGQVLVTLEDTETRRRYLNARATVGALLRLGAVPVINENDTVATTEIRYGDNDRLAARVAVMTGCDLLVLLSDVDGLYSAPPAADPDAVHIPLVEAITPRIQAMAGESASQTARGGMRTKVEAGRIATTAGTAMVITRGTGDHPLAALRQGARATWFAPSQTPVSAWKGWIAGKLEPRGKVVVDQGAARALASGKSLLAAGVRRVEGEFARADTVAIVIEGTGEEIARGLAAYDAHEARAIAGRKTSEIEAILGHAPRAAMVHRDDMVMSRKG